MSYFLLSFVATLIGGMTGRFIASRFSANKRKVASRIMTSKRADQALGSCFAFLAVFTLIQDFSTVVGADWNLGIFDDLEAKYGFLVGVIAVSIGGGFFKRKDEPDEVVETDQKRDVV